MHRSFGFTKILFSLLIVLVGLSVFPKNVFADDTPEVKAMLDEYCTRRDSNVVNLEQWYGGKCTSKNPGDRLGFGNIILYDLYEKVAGSSKESDALKTIFQNLGKTGYNPTEIQKLADQLPREGAINSIAYLTGQIMRTQPASSMDYVAYVQKNINSKHIVTPVYAASNGYGFEGLQPVLPIWKAFRNLTYFLFILVFVAYGFMIMFRVKLNPQTVVSIQTALPKIVITLLAITFSYAIAGLMIDMFFVLVGFIFAVLKTTIITDGSFALGASKVDFFAGRSAGLIGPLLVMLTHVGTFSLQIKLLNFFLPALVSNLVLGAVSIIGIVLMFIIAVATLLVFFRILWMLLSSFIELIIQIMFAPLILLANILPGSKAFSGWMKNIFANLSVFATVQFGFLLAFYFLGPIWDQVPQTGIGGPTSGTFLSLPPLSGVLNSTSSQGKFALIGFGIFLMIPQFASVIKKSLKVESLPYGFDLTTFLGNQKTPEGKWQADRVDNFKNKVATAATNFRGRI